jgi:hypothetical protein
MVAGIACLACTLGLHVVLIFGSRSIRSAEHSRTSNGTDEEDRVGVLGSLLGLGVWAPGQKGLPVPTFGLVVAAGVAAHALGQFSFFFLLAEGEERGPSLCMGPWIE